MIGLICIIPILACLVLGLIINYDGNWTAYFNLIIIGETTALVSYWFFYRKQTRSREFLGSIVQSIHYEQEWIELTKRQISKTDSAGKVYYQTVIDELKKPEKFYMVNSDGKEMSIDQYFFDYVKGIWQLTPNHDQWSGSNIKGGKRLGCHYTMEDFDFSERINPRNWIPVTEIGTYKNLIKNSNSIYKFEAIGEDRAQTLGLYDYPKIDNLYDAPCILSDYFPVDNDIDQLFRKFNAVYAPKVQMRLFILLFRAKMGVSIAELQRAYWQGGNKNEFVICLGLKTRNIIEWARCFSWSDTQDIELKTSRWLMNNPNLDWNKFHDRFVLFSKRWKRKEFSEFNYLRIQLLLWQNCVILVVVILVIIIMLTRYI